MSSSTEMTAREDVPQWSQGENGPDMLRHLCSTHLSHSQTSSHKSTTAKSVTYTLCGTTNLLLKGLRTLQEHLHMGTNSMPITWTESTSFTGSGSSWLKVCLYPHLTCSHPCCHNFFSDMALEGTPILHVLFQCPPRGECNLWPKVLGKVAVWLNMKFRFLETEFKEIFSYTGKKKKPTGEGVKIKH